MLLLPRAFYADNVTDWLDAIRAVADALPPANAGKTVEHIHTTYSFSPYTPAAAALTARLCGAGCAGIVDHDTLAGAREFLAACDRLSLRPLLGLEHRVSFKGTPFEDAFLNDPLERGVAYMTMQRVVPGMAAFLTDAFAPRREARLVRERAVAERAAEKFPEAGLSFERDVLPLTRYRNGGTVTERHVLFALSLRLTAAYGRGKRLADTLSRAGVRLTEERKNRLSDEENPYLLYDLAHMLKSDVLDSIYVPAAEECMTLEEFAALSRKAGAVCCYCYLGDVTASVTDDKRPGRFEDAYLPELLRFLKERGVGAVTHSRRRNSPKQTERLLELCRTLSLETIEGEDINSPRQTFL